MCGGAVESQVIDNYPYIASGLSNVQLDGVVKHTCKSCGETYTDLLQIDKIHQSISQEICGKTERLTSEELRFLRKELQLKSVDFARMLSVSPEHLSRLENGQKDISEITDKFVRMLYLAYQSEHFKKVVHKGILQSMRLVRPKAGKKKGPIKIINVSKSESLQSIKTFTIDYDKIPLQKPRKSRTSTSQ
jgi:DNA-binding transcriptional regulator YiaG